MADVTREEADKMAMGNAIPVMLLDNVATRSRFQEEQRSIDDMSIPNASLLPPLLREQDEAATLEGSGEQLAPDRERLLLEHLPTVRYLARRIHERLPQHVELDDLISRALSGSSTRSRSSIMARRSSSRATRSFVYAGRFWILCARWTGAHGSCAARVAPSKRRFARRHRSLGAPPPNRRLPRPWRSVSTTISSCSEI